MNSLAIMQPYLFPYLGYFQMIKSVDKFIFYDDVNFIKQGWINRNNILSQGKRLLFTVPLLNQSSSILIKDVLINTKLYGNWKQKFLKTIEHSYKKAPYYSEVFSIIENCLNYNTELISELAMQSIITIAKYLQLPTEFEVSSQSYANTKGLDKADRLIKICKINNADNYINAIGGQELYNKTYFSENNITLNFIKCNMSDYQQFNNDFQAGLSIIDVLMFNNIGSCKEFLLNYQLI